MFRHSDLDNKHRELKEFKLDQEFNQSINESIRFFKVPATREKSDVLNVLLNDITGLRIVRPEKNRARRLYVAIGSVASAACLLLFLWYFAFSFKTISGVQVGSNVYYLPDHSKVILSPDSEIKYSKLFFNREVALDGEAYFEVEKGSKFSVKTPNGEVRVLGTRFSVSDKDDGFVVCCFEGKVQVSYGNEERQLLAGNKFNSAERNIIPLIKTTPDTDIAYFDQAFYNKSLKEIWPIVEKHFGVTIYSNIPVDRKFTGSIHSKNVKEVIDIICTSLDMSYMSVNDGEFLIQNGI
jgi:ferric-dicitrate binding protein FerR (iron transport regulator)